MRPASPFPRPESLFLRRVLTALREAGAHSAFVVPDGTAVSYPDAFEELRRLYEVLAEAGLGGDDVVAVSGGPGAHPVLAQLAGHLCGASVLLVPESAAPRSLRGTLDAAGVTAVLVEPGGEPGHAHGGRRIVPLPPAPARARSGSAARNRGEAVPATGLPSSVHTVFGSGGTTGTPKLISHRGIYDGMAHIFGPDGHGPDRILLSAPLTHLTGNCAALGALLGHDTIVFHADPGDGFAAGTALRQIEQHRITQLTLTPPRLAALLDHPDLPRTDVSSVRRLSLGASPVPRRRLAQALEAFGPVVGQGYGLTEAPMIAGIDAGEYEGHPERLGSVGRIVPGMEARIADDGEVLVRGLALMEGYHRDPEATARAFTDGWLHTGDLGHLDDGYLYLAGRADDVVVTGEHGTKVHPALVEDVITTHPLVRQAAVVGVAGPDGDRLHAVVVADDGVTADDVVRRVRVDLGRAHFVPTGVCFTDTIPLTPVGKIDRAAVRDLLTHG